MIFHRTSTFFADSCNEIFLSMQIHAPYFKFLDRAYYHNFIKTRLSCMELRYRLLSRTNVPRDRNVLRHTTNLPIRELRITFSYSLMNFIWFIFPLATAPDRTKYQKSVEKEITIRVMPLTTIISSIKLHFRRISLRASIFVILKKVQLHTPIVSSYSLFLRSSVIAFSPWCNTFLTGVCF